MSATWTRLGRRAARLRAALAVLLLLGGCSDDRSETLGTRAWGSIDVAVETRPFPPLAGNDEVVVIVSGAHRRPVYDAVVSIRAQPSAPWVQAIQDGHLGVYRRAVHFTRNPGNALEVQLRRGGDETVLAFPVTLGSAP